MTSLVAFYTVINAQKYLLQTAREHKPTGDYPIDVVLAVDTLREAERQLRADLVNVVKES